ncbi:MAG: O-antigen ligase domain-containing protein, partial [Alphaproteobacteria bacterium]
RWLLFAGGSIAWALIFWSGARGAALAFVLALPVIATVARQCERKHMLCRCFFAALLGASLSFLYPIDDPAFGLLRFYTTTVETDSFHNLTTSRSELWAEAIMHWQRAPWFGVGAGHTLLVLKTAGGQFAQPHNIVIQALLAWGVVGALPFLALIAGLLWRAAQAVQRAAPGNGAGGAAGLMMALALLGNAMLDAALYYPLPTWLFVIGLCVALAGAQGMLGSGP